MRSLGPLLLLLFAVVSSFSQPPAVQVAVRFAPVTRQADSLQRAVCRSAGDDLRSLGVQVADSVTGYILFADAAPSGAQTVLSFWLCHALPAEAVDVCARAEIFYAGISPDRRAAFPAEGKWVRQLMSADFVRQFVTPLESRLVVVPAGRVREAVQQEMHLFADMILKGRPAVGKKSTDPGRR